MPWLAVNELRDVLSRLDLLSTAENCPDCGAWPGQPHSDGCDVERCSACGSQRLSCACEGNHDKLFARWSGFWPGQLECLALGLVSRWEPDAEHPVPADSLCRLPKADLNRFMAEGWHLLFWIKPNRREGNHSASTH